MTGIEMKYKVGDKVRIKSIDWYNENKNERGYIKDIDEETFVEEMSEYCGLTAIIKNVIDGAYKIDVDNERWSWTDGMIEGLVEDKKPCDYINFNAKSLSFADKVELNLGEYEVKEENGKWFAVKKKREYPKTYKKCLVMTSYNKEERLLHLLDKFRQLFICRDAYWKIAGEEMGLDKPWEPDWSNGLNKFCLVNCENRIIRSSISSANIILAFPTEEMRDTFYENFMDEIEQCKELL